MALSPAEILPMTNQDLVSIFLPPNVRPRTPTSPKYRSNNKMTTKTKQKKNGCDPDPGYDAKMLDKVMQAISAQSEELYYSEGVWKSSYEQKRLAKQCLNKKGRSANAADAAPTVQKAKEWADEKNFWLSYLPRQRRIWEYESENGGYWELYENDPRDANLIIELQKDNVTGEPISFYERCQRYQKRIEWEEKLMADFDKTQQSARLKNRELTLTLQRYKGFGKNLMENLKDVQTESNNLDRNRSSRRYRQTEMERLEQGYKTLKSIYDINPGLVQDLAEQHKNGPAGKHWMGLSRDDIEQVLKILERTQADPNYCPFPLTPKRNPGQDSCTPRGLLLQHQQQSRTFLPPSHSRTDLTATRRLSCTPREPIPKPQVVMRKKVRGRVNMKKPLKPAQLMPLHIPGPDSLHKNVVIRAFSAEMDGRPEYDLEGGSRTNTACGVCNVYNSMRDVDGKKRKSRPCTPTSGILEGNVEGSCGGCGGIIPKQKTNWLESSDDQTDGNLDEEEEGLTIESFIPFYMVTR